jgi:hypothetical protein
MKHVLYILAVMFIARTPMLAETGPTGTWIVEGAGQEFPWEAVLRADGPNRLLGALSSCASVRRPIEISNGNIQGNTISFKVDIYLTQVAPTGCGRRLWPPALRRST